MGGKPEKHKQSHSAEGQQTTAQRAPLLCGSHRNAIVGGLEHSWVIRGLSPAMSQHVLQRGGSRRHDLSFSLRPICWGGITGWPRVLGLPPGGRAPH